MKEFSNKIKVLGSGTSTGIPMIGCSCTVCSSENPKDNRLRASILITTKSGKKILIDTTPDFRAQALNNKISHINSVIITHEHADHLHGIDDLRPLSFSKNSSTIKIYAAKDTVKAIKDRFGYMFPKDRSRISQGWIPKVSLTEIYSSKIHSIAGLPFSFFQLPHGQLSTTGFIQDNFAYITDCSSIPNSIIEQLKQAELDLLIIECIRDRPHKTHLNRELTFKYIEEIRPKRVGLIHMGHYYSHESLTTICSSAFQEISVFPLYDGQQLEY